MAAQRPEIIIVNNVPVDFAPFGIVSSLTARINAVMGPQPHLDCVAMIQLDFYDTNGNVLAEKTARLSPTAVESLEFTPGREAVGRTQIRPQILIEWPPGPCRGAAIANVEVYNNETGETKFVVAGQ